MQEIMLLFWKSKDLLIWEIEVQSTYCKVSNIRYAKSQNLNASNLIL